MLAVPFSNENFSSCFCEVDDVRRRGETWEKKGRLSSAARLHVLQVVDTRHFGPPVRPQPLQGSKVKVRPHLSLLLAALSQLLRAK